MMEKLYKNLKQRLLFLPLLFIFNSGIAQFCMPPTQTVGLNPTILTQTTPTYSTGAAICFTFNGTQGCGYFFSTCNLSTLDTYLRLYSGVGSTLLINADDQCGAQSQITWTCPTNGVYSILLNEYNCVALTGTTRMSYSTSCAPPCTGTPAATSIVVTPTGAICPGSTAFLNLANNYTVGGISYQWQSSSSSTLGPWSSAGTSSSITTPSLNSQISYQCVITCGFNNFSFYTNPVTLNIAQTVTNSVPYFEGFEGIGYNDRLPNCSWSASNLGTSAKTYTGTQTQNRVAKSGSKFASFYYLPGSTNYFWTNGIQLDAGITYSAATWYTTEFFGYTTWNNLSILYGASQSTNALTQIASSVGPAVSPIYKSLSNTFSVASSGIYYLAISATSDGSCCGNYLSWDDLEITIPCIANPVNVAISPANTTTCVGSSIVLTASGANSYTWSTGAVGSSITVAPGANQSYYVSGTSTLTSCNGSASANIILNPAPMVSIFADKIALCKGESALMFAYGASNYQWSTLSNSAQIVVTPSSTTIYSVTGFNQYGCSGTATEQIVVLPSPTVSAISTSTNLCVGETVTLQASGALTYEWLTSSIFVKASKITVSPNITTTYTITGTDTSGCESTSYLTLNVNACTGIAEFKTNQKNFNVFPNPGKGEFILELNDEFDKTIEVIDFTGGLLQTIKSNKAKVNINITNYANGIYYIKVISNNNTGLIKVVKE